MLPTVVKDGERGRRLQKLVEMNNSLQGAQQTVPIQELERKVNKIEGNKTAKWVTKLEITEENQQHER